MLTDFEMPDSSPPLIAEYRDCRRGVDDVVQLFAHHVDVRWKRSNQSGEFSLPLFALSPHFDRRCGTGDGFHQLFWPGVVLLVVAAMGWFTIPLPISDYVGAGAGVPGGLFVLMSYFAGKSNDTQWSFMNIMHSATIMTFGARPQDVAAAEAFVAMLVKQIRSDPGQLTMDVCNPGGSPD